MIYLRTLLRGSVLTAALFVFPLAASAASISIDQSNEEGIIGKWTMIRPDQLTESGASAQKSWDSMPIGNYTLFFEEPDGTQASVRIYVNDIQTQQFIRPQLNFTLNENDNIRITVHYPFLRTGSVAITSDPAGVTFVLEGPNDMRLEGVTPYDLEKTPEGTYAVQFKTPKGCPIPGKKSNILEKDARISFTIVLTCDGAEELRNKNSEEKSKYISAKVGAADVYFEDVPQDSWFAPHVFNAAKWGIISGYRDDAGKPTGEFGPDKNVTIAELLKIAHKAGGISEAAFGTTTENPNASNQWFSQYFVSAEQNAWMVYLDLTLEPGRNASRAEVVATLMQAFDQPLDWAKGNVFTDVAKRTPYANAIETAARLKLIDVAEEKGSTINFRPTDPINRAEISKMLTAFIDHFRNPAKGNTTRFELPAR